MNKNELVKQLKFFGLTKNEILVYIAAVQRNVFSLSEIAAFSGLPRTTCYSVVGTLLKKGFVARIPENKSKRFAAIDPLVLIETKRQEVQSAEKAMRYVSLLKKTGAAEGFAKIEVFKNIDGFQQVHNRILNDNPKEIISITNPDFIYKNFPKEFRDCWVDSRIKKNIKVRSLRPSTKTSNGQISSSKQKDREIRVWPEIVSMDSMFFAWDNKVGFISTKKERMSFVITSQEFSGLFQKMFEQVWEENAYHARVNKNI